MTQYLLAIYRDGHPLSEDDFNRSYTDVNALADELEAGGGLVFAGGLNHDPTTVFRPASGEIVRSDGPFIETKELLGGFWIIEAEDHAAAQGWGRRLAAACRRTIEVSTFEADDTPVEELYEHGSRGAR